MRFDWLWAQSDKIFNLFLWHSYLAIVPVVIGLILAIPVGWGIHHLPSVKSAIVNLFGLLYTIPSLAIYSFALLVRTVCDGLDSVSADTRQSAAALGYKPAQQFFQIDLPLAVPVIGSGLRVAVVSNVSIVSVAALIGAPQLGSLFTLGFQLQFLTPIIAGIALSIILALLLDMLVVYVTRQLSRWQPQRG
ncbi:ABC transporter permease [Klebsiella pneumoniae]|uniref:ABC transporter permease n=1 Tax=Klebsiella pneumoniae TaxID=573 RepID=UPI000DE5CCB7|nr:ABC transporter permease subunit [Klebsiella pneumoniae]SSI72642.1 L-proline glycine betaine ABC transport system permease protein ProW [Klebsiella pneumoniae]